MKANTQIMIVKKGNKVEYIKVFSTLKQNTIIEDNSILKLLGKLYIKDCIIYDVTKNIYCRKYTSI